MPSWSGRCDCHGSALNVAGNRLASAAISSCGRAGFAAIFGALVFSKINDLAGLGGAYRTIEAVAVSGAHAPADASTRPLPALPGRLSAGRPLPEVSGA